jgi:hypothetical protein
LSLLNKMCEITNPFADSYFKINEKEGNRIFNTIELILEQYDILNWVVIHLTLNIGVVKQLTNNKSNTYPNLVQRKQGWGGSLIQHKVSSVQEVEEVSVPVLDNEGTLEDIWYGMVGAILSYLMPQGQVLF